MFDPLPPPQPVAAAAELCCTVNGRPCQVALEPGVTLLEMLRNDLGLTGSRFGCGLEQCGACLVLLDGRPRHACQMAAADMAGRTITTIEGLHEDAAGQRLIAQFLAHQAGQCGYCLSGIVIQAHAWLATLTQRPARAEIAAALADNLCRCGAHPRILAAVQAAADERFPA